MDSLKAFRIFEHAYTQMKHWHHQTKSDAEHRALAFFYDGIKPLADQYVEICIAEHGEKSETFGMKFNEYKVGNSMIYLSKFVKILRDMKTKVNVGALQNIIDEIEAIALQTKYLLGRT